MVLDLTEEGSSLTTVSSCSPPPRERFPPASCAPKTVSSCSLPPKNCFLLLPGHPLENCFLLLPAPQFYSATEQTESGAECQAAAAAGVSEQAQLRGGRHGQACQRVAGPAVEEEGGTAAQGGPPGRWAASRARGAGAGAEQTLLGCQWLGTSLLPLA